MHDFGEYVMFDSVNYLNQDPYLYHNDFPH
jgi:hypothetical protein